jgi:G3E family GTPase
MKDKKKETVNIYFIAGFLGSGKTTAVAAACKQLIRQEKKVAVITNDQGDQQVDTYYLQSLSIPNTEIANGCFCCNYEALEKEIIQFTASFYPEIIFAESVGSCTDLIATIAKPFALWHPGFRVLISVFADAALLYSILDGTSGFIEDAVQYIYKKQLEEADILVINKIDLLATGELQQVKEMIEGSYPGKIILYQDSFSENDISNWLQTMADFQLPVSRKSLELDYDLYGAGEAALAWLDKKISIHTQGQVAIETAIQLAARIAYKIKISGYTIGHLKFFLGDDDGWFSKISYTTSGRMIDMVTDGHPTQHIRMLINARVQTSPELLLGLVADLIHETMTEKGCRILHEKENAFQPGYPRPLHRIAD